MASSTRVLIIDDKASMLGMFQEMLGDRYDLTTTADPEEGLRHATNHDFDVVVTDIKMPKKSGLEILTTLKARKPTTEVIVMTAYADVSQAVGAMKQGAYDYITKPFDPDEMVLVIQKAAERKRLLEQTDRLQRQVEHRYRFDTIIGTSPAMQAVFRLMEEVCQSPATVLVSGESGTGKELVAHAIHFNSPRAKGPFVAINCAAIPRELLESELFGHLKGAFSGAGTNRRGLVEQADGGTLFLDEISEMELDLQGKITRMIQEREIRPVGGSAIVKVDVRIIAATNVDLEEAVRLKRFREDLYYRVHVFPIEMPPLRERPDDIPLLVDHFLMLCSKREGKSIHAVSPDAMAALTSHRWPGNVRELANVVERAVILTRSQTIELGTLPELIRSRPKVTVGEIDIDRPYKELIQSQADAVGSDYINKLFTRFRGNVTRSADHAGMERETLHRLAKRLGIDPDRYRKEL